MSKRNRKTLKYMIKRLFSDYKKIKVTKRIVYLKRRWYSLTRLRMQVVDLVLLQIPHAINNLCKENGYDVIIEESYDLASAVEHFEGQQDIIQYLQYQINDLDMSIALNDNYSAEPCILKRQVYNAIKEIRITKKIFTSSISYYMNIITDVIEEIKSNVKVVYMNTESACNSPPIRAPGLKVA